jgi:pilus assembly protein CpaE
LLVAQLELTSLRNIVRMMHTMEKEEGLGDKLKVVMNCAGNDNGDITLEKAQETIGKPIFWQIPSDTKAMLGARNAGVPLMTHAPKSKAHTSIVGLANILCGKASADAPKKERRSFFSFR